MKIKDIEGFENYQITDDGRVWSKWLKDFMKLKIAKGYYAVNLNKNGIKYTKNVHKLVATAFIPNPDNKPCIGHNDGNSLNNKVENLYWCTYPENNNHPITKERQHQAGLIMYKKRKRDQFGRFSS